jgi:hypothetical protein
VNARTPDGAWREVFSRTVDASSPYTTSSLRPGETELEVLLTSSAPAFGATQFRDDGATVSRQTTNEPATYVVGPAGGRQVRFTITLNLH